MKTAAAIPTALICLVLLFHTAVSAQTSPGELDRYFGNMLQSQKYVALGACFCTGDTIAWEGYYGFADLEAKKPLKRDNIFQLASLSKTVTATALLQLLERSALSSIMGRRTAIGSSSRRRWN